MDNLYIISKQEFTSLYRFGKLPINKENIIKTEGFDKEKLDYLVFNQFLKNPFFIGDEEYLIVSFRNKLFENNYLEIESLTEVIPLTSAAKQSYEMKFDSKILFKEARFEHVVRKVEEEIDFLDMQEGARGFWTLCKLDNEFKELVSQDVIRAAYLNRVNGSKLISVKDFISNVLIYDRYDFFPNNDLGFFYDVGEIFAHSKQKPTFKGSGFHKFLEDNKDELYNLNLLEIAKIIDSNEEIFNFTSQLTINEVKEYISVAIFLKFKSDLIERDSIKGSNTGKLIGDIKRLKHYNKELELAIYLTGAFFGYKKFYDDIYEISGLQIFKNTSEKRKAEIKEKSISKITKLKSVDIDSSKSEDYKIQILISIKELVKESNGRLELKGENLKQLKKSLKRYNKAPKIDDIVQIFREHFIKDFYIESVGKKYFVRIKEEQLF